MVEKPAVPALKVPDTEHRKELLTHRSWLNQTDYQTATEYDKQLGILAGGALTFSVGFFKDIIQPAATAVPVPPMVWDARVALGVSWFLFTATLVMALHAYGPARDMLKAAIASMDDQLTGSPDPAEAKKLQDKIHKARDKAVWRNKAALYFFNFGMLVQFYFLVRRFFL